MIDYTHICYNPFLMVQRISRFFFPPSPKSVPCSRLKAVKDCDINKSLGEIAPETTGEQEQGEGEDVNLPELMSQVSESSYIHSPDHWFNGCQYKCQVII